MKLNNEIISSRANARVRWAASLSDKKSRAEERSFIAEGEKLTLEALEAHLPVTHIFIAESRFEREWSLLSDYADSSEYENVAVIRLEDTVFEKISTEKAPQGIISVIKYLDFFNTFDIIYKEDFFSSADERTLALFSVRDPGNLGAVIRSAVAFGVDHIVLSSDCADVYNHKTVRAAMGSLFRTRISTVRDFGEFISVARESGRRVFAAELTEGARSLRELDTRASDIFIIGNEGHGIPREISSLTDGSVYIPISRKTESLNASVAAAVFMWEISK